MTSTLCCAYLRVYQPVRSMAVDEVEQLERAERVGEADPDGGLRPHALGLVAPSERRDFYEKVVDGERYVCPAHTWLRTLLGLVAFERTLPEGATHLFFSEEELRAARRELERIESDLPGVQPPLVQSAWHVPLRWFVCFDDVERRIEHHGEHLTIRYETTMAKARQRADHALKTLKGGIVHPVIVGMVFELKEWLGFFDERSILELDYASVARLFDDEELADDHSAKDVWEAIAALSEKDGLRAGLHYQRANERWTRARGRESLN